MNRNEGSKMHRLVRPLVLFSVFALMLTIVAPSGGDDNKKEESKSSGENKFVNKGNELIAALPKIPFGIHKQNNLQADQNEKPYATSRSDLTAIGIGDKVRYKYSDVSILRGDKGEVLEVKTVAIFDQYFKPEEIDWEIIEQNAQFVAKTRRESLRTDGDEYVFTKTDHDGKKTETRYAIPKENFVYFTPDLLGLMDLKPGDRFLMRDINPETGELNSAIYSVAARPNEQLRVGKKKIPSKVETEYFVLENDGSVARHGLVEFGMTFNATSRNIVEGVEKACRRHRRAA